ncbi:hypothetical protein RRG08_010903 [Elysia crispata]|uniref:Uncharacterized protein n=1 Tax=Elysia crispata TaxID=231223 RepID=A0AAE1DPR2_9GAST|nr:hypothetical protein RRG08_010903 [Elysia crispata]
MTTSILVSHSTWPYLGDGYPSLLVQTGRHSGRLELAPALSRVDSLSNWSPARGKTSQAQAMADVKTS